jgi:CubicO group peptidase (beta-lactamase class C family)
MNYAVEPSEAVGMSARRLERIRPAMQAYVDRGVYAGVSTLIARRGKVVHAGEFGWRDKEAGSPMTADTIFRLYSMTKPIICTALMTLLEEGRFRLIEPLAKYIPAFGAVKVLEADGGLVAPVRPILIRDLMTHMSAFPTISSRKPALARCTRNPSYWPLTTRLKTRSTISRGFRSPSSQGLAGATASASTSRPG